MSDISRVSGVFFEPKKTFEDIGRRPTFVLPLALVMLFVMGYTIMIGQRIGWDRINRQRIEQSSRAQQVSPEQREQQIAIGSKISQVVQFVVPVFVLIGDLVVAAVLLAMASGIMSAGLKFKQVFAITAWAGLPSGLFVSILGVVVIFLKKPEDFNMDNPLAFNPAAFMDPQSSSKFLYSLASSIDLFSFWTILLMATGLKAAAGKRLSFGGALFCVMLPWGIYVLGKSALAGVFA